MLLATYQPHNEAKKDICRDPELTMRLGYDPIFCFPANNAREAILYSMIVNTATYPEKLVFFETDEYDPIDIVQWNRKLAIDYKVEQERFERGTSKTQPMNIEDCFTDADALYKCHLVKSIDNIVVEMDIKDMMFLDVNTEVSEWRSFLSEVIKSAQKCALSVCSNLNPPVSIDTSWDEYALLPHQIIKEGFQGLLLPLMYPIALDKPISFSTYFDYQKYMNLMTLNKITRLSSADESLEFKTYEYFNEIARDLRSCMQKTYDRTLSDGFNKTETELGPNSMCPCGSGKKYKKCCRHTTIESL